MDRGAWRATVHGVAKSRTRLSRFFLLSSSLSPASPVREQNRSYYSLWGSEALTLLACKVLDG